ncbi:Two-component transcriptional response regulator, LuxR family [hydrothermal vent metagenome]|uniref:Two-component transcriptional response regulator, LuxR family n=1 Tax=hydrothermal vent metagenome TaxID=652676 RepID=A0A3B1AAS1_9ZZZZ
MKILIIDDHALFREGLCYVLNDLEDSMTIYQASDYAHALIQLRAHLDMDLVLLDLKLPGKDGFSILNLFSEQYPALPIIILSASNKHSDVQRSLDAGAMGYIPKDTTSAVMLNALRLVLSGGIYMPASIVKCYDNNQAAESFIGITPRQQQVLGLMVQGHSNKMIASQLELAEGTVKMHVTSILKFFGVSNRTQAVLASEKLGLFTEKAQ